MLLSVVDGREIEWIPLEESVRGAVRAARGLDRRLRGRLRGGQSYGTRAQDGVPGEVTAAELVLKAVSIHLARRVLHEHVKRPCTRSQLRGPIPAPHHSKPAVAPSAARSRELATNGFQKSVHFPTHCTLPPHRESVDPGSGTGGRNPPPHTDLPSLDLPTRPHPKRSTHP